MERSKHLILVKGADKTSDVVSCKYNPFTKKYDVTFQGGKTYFYNYNSIEWVKSAETPNPAIMRIVHSGRQLFNIQVISVFHASATDYWHIRFIDGSERTYNSHELKITYSCLSEDEARNCMRYLCQLASVSELKSDDGEILLQKQYEKLGFVGTDTVMAVYMNPQKHKVRTYQKGDFIFPFGGNASQFKAVADALSNQVSIIQGPPGTGKTQTILNIIANLLIMEKTVQVVSNNNSATRNVLEKLSSPSYALGFLVAPLGKEDNKKVFISNQTGVYPTIADWELDAGKQSDLKAKIQSHARELHTVFAAQERLAQARAERDSLNLEIRYFEQYCSEAGLACQEMKLRRRLSVERIMRLWRECRGFSEKDRAISLRFKIKGTFFYGISDWKFYKNDWQTIITVIQSLFYRSRHLELSREISALESQLTTMDAKGKMGELTEWSMVYLRAKLFERYGDRMERIQFSQEDLRKRAGDVAEEYPVVLSTAFSSCSSLKGVTYDYLIMDEASQVDIATGALALSCARNAVVVGDLKQLPNVVKDELKKRCDAIFDSYNLPQGYSFSENSFLKSVCSILHDDAPQTLLREHYRCHPKIIGFCNQKFYHNELIIMTEDRGEPDALTVFKTVAGDHRRERVNQRQIDVTIREALPMLSDVNPQDVGIIAPYNNQVAAIIQQLDSSPIEVHTVHKFQGREKDTILLTTVDDVVTDFSDDPYLLNVAVSRAKKRLSLVVSGNEQPMDSNIGDLISYIEYNNFKIVQSDIRSIFDLLYRQYTHARIAFLKRHPSVSAYVSENLMYCEIVDILERHSALSLNVICHQPLNMLIRDPKLLNDKEYRYAMNPATHIDFLLYNQVNKKPVLAIEVDGFHYHKLGTEQRQRDEMKDRILECYGIPLFRFPTNGSEECTKIEQFLAEYASGRQTL